MDVRVLDVAGADGDEAGRAYGAAVADLLPGLWAAYRHLFLAGSGVDEATALRRGAEALEVVGRWRPTLADELAGVAAAAGVAPEVVGALNARTEVVVAMECATVGRVGARPWLAQNWDWYLDAPERSIVVRRDGFTTFTEAGLLAKVGVNAAGLALSLDILRHTSDRPEPMGVPVHLLLREVLGACATVDDVAALLADSPTSASSCLTVVTADGDGATFEVAPAGVARLAPMADGLLAHTNQFVDPALAAGERLGKLASSCGRHDDLLRSRPATLDQARAALSSHTATPVPVCRHGEEQPHGLPPTGTAACILVDPVAGTLEVGLGPPCQATFTTAAVRPNVRSVEAPTG